MKKLAALLLVMVMVSAAQGTQYLTINGQPLDSITLDLDEICTIEVVSGDGTPYKDLLELKDLVVGDLTLLEIKPEAGSDALVTTVSATSYALLAEGAGLAAGVHFVFQFAAQAPGAADIELREWGGAVPFDLIEITVTEPESMGTGFTYQGRLDEGMGPANGLYDLEFKIYRSLNADIPYGAVAKEEAGVYDGYFTVELDFGMLVFSGNALWLEIGVRKGELADPNIYKVLSPRQELTPSPYALYARMAGYAQTASNDNDWMVTGNNMYAVPSGNVGIGTTIPSGKLHVEGGKAEDGAEGSKITIKAQDGGDALGGSLGRPGGDILLLPGAGGAGTIAGPSGKVGVGTDNPEVMLDVRGDIEIDQKIQAHDSGGLELATDEGATRVFIHDNGHVGIGGMTPSYPFHVKKWFDDSWISGIHNMSTNAAAHGLVVKAEGGDPLLIQSAAGDMMKVKQDGRVGIGTSDPQDLLQVWRDTTGSPGISLTNADAQGGNYSLRVGGANSSVGAGNFVVYDHAAAATRLAVSRSGKVGIGTISPISKFNVADDILYISPPGAERVPKPYHHVTSIEHSFTGDLMPPGESIAMANVLALQVHHSDETPSSLTQFIGFYGKNDNRLGSIIGNGHGGVELSTFSGDFAEWLGHLKKDEAFEPGDIVGVIGGRVSKDTNQAPQVMVVSTAPVVSGNRPKNESDLNQYEKIAFLGQVPVKVRGIVQAGDYVVASGKSDGIGIAVAADRLTPDKLTKIVGRAWESSDDPELKKVNISVGLQYGNELIKRIYEENRKKHQAIQRLEAEVANLHGLVGSLLERINDLEKNLKTNQSR